MQAPPVRGGARNFRANFIFKKIFKLISERFQKKNIRSKSIKKMFKIFQWQKTQKHKTLTLSKFRHTLDFAGGCFDKSFHISFYLVNNFSYPCFFCNQKNRVKKICPPPKAFNHKHRGHATGPHFYNQHTERKSRFRMLLGFLHFYQHNDFFNF